MDKLERYRQIIRALLTPYLYGCLIHVEIIADQRDGTEDGGTDELVVAGIAKQDIVLGFQEPPVRQYTGFAVP